MLQLFYTFINSTVLTKEQQHQMTKKLGTFLRHERMQKGISIAKIAEDLSLNPSTIVSIEEGAHKTSFVTIYMITNYLSINLTTVMVAIKAH